jgi:microcystin-dependent protein
MSDQFVAEIRPFACNFAPSGWALCNGQLLSITQFSALFSLLGTNFGGDGTRTFGLPNLQGAVALSFGQGPGLSNYVLGETGGQTSITLQPNQLGAHTHPLTGTTVQATSTSPSGLGFAKGRYTQGTTSKPLNAYSSQPANATMNTLALSPAGSTTPAPHNNMMPYLVINFCIALQGEFPPRS